MKLVREAHCWALDLEKTGVNLVYLSNCSSISYDDRYSVHISPKFLIKFIVLKNGDTFGVNYLRSILEKKSETL